MKIELATTQITEDQIKRATLRFLKDHYKFRPRIGEAHLHLDMQTDSGIIADGYIDFMEEEGTQFIASFEATSRDSIQEVLYTVQRTKLIWDSLVTAILLTVVAQVCCMNYGYFLVKDIGIIKAALLTLSFLSTVFLLYFLACRDFRRYRYIYAIEQFKRYHADEQWIALGEDVFPHGDDRYYEELREQCIINGFGLLQVNRDMTHLCLVTPSREGVFGNTRQVFNFFKNVDESSRTASLKMGMQKEIDRMVSTFNSSRISRYRKKYLHQVVLFGIGLFISAGILFNQYQDKPIQYADEQKFEASMLDRGKNAKPENAPPLVPDDATSFDTEDGPFPFDPKDAEEEYFEAIEDQPEKEVEDDFFSDQNNNIIATSESGQVFSYDCERFFNFDGRMYLVQDNVFASEKEAVERMKFLKSKKLECNILWLGCFANPKSRPGYLVFFDLMYESKGEARKVAYNYQKLLKQKKIKPLHLAIRSITR